MWVRFGCEHASSAHPSVRTPSYPLDIAQYQDPIKKRKKTVMQHKLNKHFITPIKPNSYDTSLTYYRNNPENPKMYQLKPQIKRLRSSCHRIVYPSSLVFYWKLKFQYSVNITIIHAACYLSISFNLNTRNHNITALLCVHPSLVSPPPICCFRNYGMSGTVRFATMLMKKLLPCAYLLNGT